MSAANSTNGENVGDYNPQHMEMTEAARRADYARMREEILREFEQTGRRELEERLVREARGRINQQAAQPIRQTVKEMSAPLTVNQPWCIVLPPDGYFELRGAIVHHIPKFYGMSTENPVKHVQEFMVVTATMKTNTENEETLRLKAFPFSLFDQAKNWLMGLPAGSIRTWAQLQAKFLEKFYPDAKVSLLRRELAAPKQGGGESLYEYHERFKELEANCYNHGLPQNVLIENFLNGLLPMELRLLNACANGNVRNLYPEDVWRLIGDNADQVRYQTGLENNRAKPVHSVSVTEELQELKDMMSKIMTAQNIKPKVCEFCQSAEHKTQDCPTLYDNTVDVNAVGGWASNRTSQPYGQNQQKFGLAENGFSWRNDQNAPRPREDTRPTQQPQPYQAPPRRNENSGYNHGQNREQPKKSLEDIVAQLAETVRRNEERSNKRFTHIETQLSQIATSVNALAKPEGILPSQVIENPKKNVSQVERSREIGEGSAGAQHEGTSAPTRDQVWAISDDSEPYTYSYDPTDPGSDGSHSRSVSVDWVPNSPQYHIEPEESDPEEMNPEEPNLEEPNPEDLGPDDMNLEVTDSEDMESEDSRGESCASSEHRPATQLRNVVTLTPPPTQHDPGPFVLNIVIGNIQVFECLIDTGASRNILPEAVYRRIRPLPELQPYTGRLLFGSRAEVPILGQMRTMITVEGNPVPVDFLVLQGHEDDYQTEVILGRPFLSTTGAQIDFYQQSLILRLPNMTLDYDPGGRIRHRHCHHADERREVTRTRPRMDARTYVRSMMRDRGRGRGYR